MMLRQETKVVSTDPEPKVKVMQSMYSVQIVWAELLAEHHMALAKSLFQQQKCEIIT